MGTRPSFSFKAWVWGSPAGEGAAARNACRSVVSHHRAGAYDTILLLTRTGIAALHADVTEHRARTEVQVRLVAELPHHISLFLLHLPLYVLHLTRYFALNPPVVVLI